MGLSGQEKNKLFLFKISESLDYEFNAAMPIVIYLTTLPHYYIRSRGYLVNENVGNLTITPLFLTNITPILII